MASSGDCGVRRRRHRYSTGPDINIACNPTYRGDYFIAPSRMCGYTSVACRPPRYWRYISGDAAAGRADPRPSGL